MKNKIPITLIGLIFTLFLISFVPAPGTAVCGNNICEEGEANIVGGCGPDADPSCLGPPDYVGTCSEDCETQDITCTDTDGGKNYYVNGKSYSNNQEIEGTIDCCKMEFSTNMGDAVTHIGSGGGSCTASGPYLYEAICENNIPTTVVYACPEGCNNGVCIRETDEEPCQKYYTCPTGEKVIMCEGDSLETCICDPNYQNKCPEVSPDSEEVRRSAVVECPQGKRLECWGGVCTCILVGEGEEDTAGRSRPGTAVPSQAILQDRNRLRIGECPIGCECTGSVTECLLEDGTRTITIRAGDSGNTIIQIKGVDMKSEVFLYHHNGKIYGDFEGEAKEIKVMPDEVKTTMRNRVQATLEDYNPELGDDAIYRVETKKKSRLFFLFPVREKISAQLSSQTGEIIHIRNSWWGFLARDVEEKAVFGGLGCVEENNRCYLDGEEMIVLLGCNPAEYTTVFEGCDEECIPIKRCEAI